MTEAATAQATDSELKSLSGHRNRNMLDVYSVHNLAIAKAAMQKREGLLRDNGEL